MLLQSTVKDLIRKPVAILGGGVSGQAFDRLLAALGGRGVVFDEAALNGASDGFSESVMSGFGLVVNSPGFRKDHPWIRAAVQSPSVELCSETEAAAAFWKGKIVAVTGTNGKTTVTGLLAHALRSGGLGAIVGANVGVPFSDCVMDSHSESDWAVLEVSSFQAWNLSKIRLDGVIWTNFDEDHLDWHESLEDYFMSKWRLVELAGNAPVVIGQDVAEAARGYGLRIPEHVMVLPDAAADKESAGLTLGNRRNLSITRAWLKQAGLTPSWVDSAMTDHSFPKHRFALVGERSGMRFWNDSKGTNFHAVVACLAQFSEKVWWLGGGLSKGGDLQGFCKRIAPKISRAFVFGQTGQLLKGFLSAESVPCSCYATMRDALEATERMAVDGVDVVLSPGFASFDQFSGYADRGNQFESWVTGSVVSEPAYQLSHT